MSSEGAPARTLALDVLPGRLALCRLPGDAAIPAWAARAKRMLTISRTPGELSIVADAEVVPPGEAAIGDFRALRVRGLLALDAVGVVSRLALPLAEAKIPIFPIATHDTDYVLLREPDLSAACDALERAGHHVENPPR